MRRLAPLVLAAVSCLLLAACGPPEEADEQASARASPPVFDVTAVDYAFAAPDTVPSGWVSFRMANRGRETHHFVLARLPEGHGYGDLKDDFLAPVDSLVRLREEGALDSAAFEQARQAVTPEWLGDIEVVGGMASLGPGQTSRATLRLEPGPYVIACFVASPVGRAHAFLGMNAPVTVAERAAATSPPGADVTLTSDGRELRTEGAYGTGSSTVALRIQPPPEGMEEPYTGANLMRLGGATDLEAVKGWGEEGFQNPAPARFLGGPDATGAGDTVYATVDLSPGTYAWVLYHPEAETLVERFTVEGSE